MVDEQKLRQLADTYAEAWKSSFLAANPFHTVHVRDEDMVHILAAIGAATKPLLDELQTLREERTEWRVTAENAEKDAARYRWLRAQNWEENRLGVVVRPKDNTKLGCFLPSDTLLDDTIDHMSAIESLKGQP